MPNVTIYDQAFQDGFLQGIKDADILRQSFNNVLKSGAGPEQVQSDQHNNLKAKIESYKDVTESDYYLAGHIEGKYQGQQKITLNELQQRTSANGEETLLIWSAALPGQQDIVRPQNYKLLASDLFKSLLPLYVKSNSLIQNVFNPSPVIDLSLLNTDPIFAAANKNGNSSTTTPAETTKEISFPYIHNQQIITEKEPWDGIFKKGSEVKIFSHPDNELTEAVKIHAGAVDVALMSFHPNKATLHGNLELNLRLKSFNAKGMKFEKPKGQTEQTTLRISDCDYIYFENCDINTNVRIKMRDGQKAIFKNCYFDQGFYGMFYGSNCYFINCDFSAKNTKVGDPLFYINSSREEHTFFKNCYNLPTIFNTNGDLFIDNFDTISKNHMGVSIQFNSSGTMDISNGHIKDKITGAYGHIKKTKDCTIVINNVEAPKANYPDTATVYNRRSKE